MTDRIAFERVTLPPVAELEPEWRALHAAAHPSFFTAWHWIGTLLETLPATARPDLLRGVAGGVTVALALLGHGTERRRRGLIRSRIVAVNETGDPRCDAITIEHNGLVAAAAQEAAALDGLCEWFARHRRDADELRLGGMARPLSEAIAARHGLGLATRQMPSYAVELGRLAASGGDLAAVLSPNARQQLRRAIRRFERGGRLRLTRAADAAEAQEYFTALKALHCRSWRRRGKAHAFAAPFFELFHRRLIDRAFAAGVIDLLRIAAGDEVLGYLYNFRFGDRVYAYQSGFAEPEAGARPGAVSHALAIRDAYRGGAQIYDFMAGHNRLKQSFATDRTAMLWVRVQQPRLRFRLERLGLALWRAGAGSDKDLAGKGHEC